MVTVTPLKIALGHALSGWSFFFRIPGTHVEPFRPNGIFLGPLYQAAVLGAACYFFDFISRTIGLTMVFELRLFMASIVLAGLTGFFHEDGLADTADGLGVPRFDGSHERIEKIRMAMKDSRIGSYGAIALTILWIFRFKLTTSGTLDVWSFIGIIFWSRLLGLGIASALMSQATQKASSSMSMASHALTSTSQRSRLLWSGAMVLLGGLAFAESLLWAAKICFAGIAGGSLLFWLSRRTQRICGDLIGASICIMEVTILLILQ
jgi:adenosylcobinamide-GDP ribazoletransferase